MAKNEHKKDLRNLSEAYGSILNGTHIPSMGMMPVAQYASDEDNESKDKTGKLSDTDLLKKVEGKGTAGKALISKAHEEIRKQGSLTRHTRDSLARDAYGYGGEDEEEVYTEGGIGAGLGAGLAAAAVPLLPALGPAGSALAALQASPAAIPLGAGIGAAAGDLLTGDEEEAADDPHVEQMAGIAGALGALDDAYINNEMTDQAKQAWRNFVELMQSDDRDALDAYTQPE
tara:strand:+ start:35 stop:724 length:690 start_codon:yes stop_codon:yes gene_type:complete